MVDTLRQKLTDSPYAPHVLTADTIEMSHDAEKQTLHLTRLMLKKGRLPQWSTKFLRNITESWILEESFVDLHQRTMWTRTCNVDHKRVCEGEDSLFMIGSRCGRVSKIYCR
jgi:4-amino-4-deoxychorismate lyase